MMAVYGKHLSFPFRIGADGRAASVSGLEEHIRDEVIQLVLTNVGERVFLPQFGGNVKRILFEGVSDAATALTKASLTQAINQWLGHRIAIEELAVHFEESTVFIDLKYKIIGTGESRVLRFETEA